MKACESGVVEPHFHSELELQVELYSCGCGNEKEPCPHGYGYEELDVDEFFEEQSTIYLSDEDDKCVDDLIDKEKMEIPVKHSKSQKKELEEMGKEEKYKAWKNAMNMNHRGRKCSQRM